MGINNLNKFNKQKAPNSKQNIKAKDFSGLRIAIDAHGLAYQFMARSNKGNISSFNIRLDPFSTADNYKRDSDWYRYFIETGNTFSSLGIVPVFVFDGASIPEKKETQQARREEKKKVFDRMKELEIILSEKSISQRSDEDVEELRRLKSSTPYVQRDLLDSLKDLLLDMGYPVVSGVGEGEKTCSMLALEGKVAGVFSKDTDCLALGCPIMLHSMIGNDNRMLFEATIYDEILNSINFLPNEFLDLCILAGTDFSNNLPNYGIIKMYSQMRKMEPGSRNIENVLSAMEKQIKEVKIKKNDITNEDIANLNHEKCRSKKIFGRERAIDTIDPKYDGVMPSLDINVIAMNSDHIKEKMESMGVSDMYHLTRSSFKNISLAHNYKGGSEKILKKGLVVARTGKINFVITSEPKKAPPKEKIKITQTAESPMKLLEKKEDQSEKIGKLKKVKVFT